MNKFIIVALLACSSLLVASATPIEIDGSEEGSSALNPSNDEEIAQLTDLTRPFSDFCLSTRDFVIGDIKSRSNGFASNIFNVLFNSAENIGLQAVEVQRDATEKLATQIRDPSAKIAAPTNEVEEIIAKAQKSIQEESSQPKSLLTGFIGVLSATKNSVTANVMSKVSDLRSGLGLNVLTGALKGACDRIDAYEQDIRGTFDSVKAQAVAADASLAKVNIEDVACVTARRVIRLDGICKFAMAAKNPMIKAITYKPVA